ncbi:MAG: hypothetical protein EBZ74_10995, partial [Planctomycetia bacterium]|nr:hypothetical protein [Planctomycetia bacterium]
MPVLSVVQKESFQLTRLPEALNARFSVVAPENVRLPPTLMPSNSTPRSARAAVLPASSQVTLEP